MERRPTRSPNWRVREPVGRIRERPQRDAMNSRAL